MRRTRLGAAMLITSLAAAILGVPAAANAGTVGGGGCAPHTVAGVSLQSCISYRASGPALYLDGYVNSLGGRSCVQVHVWAIINGGWENENRRYTLRGPATLDAFRRPVTVTSATQTARTVLRVYTCYGTHLGDAASWEQRW